MMGGGEDHHAAAVGPRLPRVLAQVTAEASPGGLGSRRGRKDGEEGMVGVVEKTTMLPQLGLGYRGSLHMSQQHGGVGDWEEGWRRDGGGEAAAAVGPRLPKVLAQVAAAASPGGASWK